MDRKLVAWGRAVKARARRLPSPGWRGASGRQHSIPALFLFLDDRLADPVGSVRRVCAAPGASGLFAIVLRARDPERRAVLAGQVAPLCRRASVPLFVSADPRLARRVGAVLHWPDDGSRRSGAAFARTAHDRAGVARARRQLAALLFVSPVFRTASHPGARPLGPARAASLARRAGPRVAPVALGGVDGRTARLLPPVFRGAAAVGALA